MRTRTALWLSLVVLTVGETGVFSTGRVAEALGPVEDTPVPLIQAQTSDWFSRAPTGRSVVRATHGMVAPSQPLASQVGLDVLMRGGNAVDAAIAMAAVLNVTEPNMTGIGGDPFTMVYSATTRKPAALNASGRAPRALTADRVTALGHKQMPLSGMETINVPGAFDGW